MSKTIQWQEFTQFSNVQTLEAGIVGTKKTPSKRSVETDHGFFNNDGTEYFLLLNKHSGDLKEQSITERDNALRNLPF